MSGNTNLRAEQVRLYENNGWVVFNENKKVTVMVNESGNYVKIDEDGMVVPFKPLNG